LIDKPFFQGEHGYSPDLALAKGIFYYWGPKVLWRKSIGDGFSAISVVEDRLYTAYTVDDEEVLFCLNANDGKERWRFRKKKPARRFCQASAGPCRCWPVESCT